MQKENEILNLLLKLNERFLSFRSAQFFCSPQSGENQAQGVEPRDLKKGVFVQIDNEMVFFPQDVDPVELSSIADDFQSRLKNKALN